MINNNSRVFCAPLAARNLQYIPHSVPAQTAVQVGFLLLDNFSLTCFSQALEVLSTANSIAAGSVRVHTFSVNDAEVTSDLAIPIRPSMPLTEVRLRGLDLMVVCGGLRTPRSLPKGVSALLHKLGALPITLGGLCNGAWHLGEAGLLDGYGCAIHPEQRTALAERVPRARVSLEPVVVDRDRYTAATPLGALQMMLKWLGQAQGAALSGAVVDTLDYDACRFRRRASLGNKPLCRATREVLKLMESNVEEPLELRQLAQCVGLSTRQIQRLFKEQLGTTPQKYYFEVRITEARRLLQHSGHRVVDVALACGFVSPSHFSRNYRALFGHPPSQERRQDGWNNSAV